jgi:hypothetical protein
LEPWGRLGEDGNPCRTRNPVKPFRANGARRRHISKQKRKVTNWAYDESLRQRWSLKVWFSKCEVKTSNVRLAVHNIAVHNSLFKFFHSSARPFFRPDSGGLPRRLEGMAMTCHEQQSLPEYVAFRDRLYSFSRSQIAANEIIPAKCEADSKHPESRETKSADATRAWLPLIGS